MGGEDALCLFDADGVLKRLLELLGRAPLPMELGGVDQVAGRHVGQHASVGQVRV
jgi:hypothetical protein